MKKILLSAVMAIGMITSVVNAESFGSRDSVDSDNVVGTMMGDNIIYVYRNHENSKLTDKFEIQMLRKQIENGICSNPATKATIKKGINYIFLYPNKDLTEMVSISVTDCK